MIHSKIRVSLIVFAGVLVSGCGILALPFQLASIPLNAISPKNTYIVNPEKSTPTPTTQGAILSESVVRVICDKSGESGTGFLHISGAIITAAHVISSCNRDNIRVVFPDRTEMGVTKAVYNASIDIAALYPNASVVGRRILLLSQSSILTIGEQITFWGFPEGVSGSKPILSTGNIAGLDTDPIYEDQEGKKPLNTQLWVLTANINKGSSGSPVISIEDGSIVGMIVRRSSRSSGLGNAVPAVAIRSFLVRLKIEP